MRLNTSSECRSRCDRYQEYVKLKSNVTDLEVNAAIGKLLTRECVAICEGPEQLDYVRGPRFDDRDIGRAACRFRVIELPVIGDNRIDTAVRAILSPYAFEALETESDIERAVNGTGWHSDYEFETEIDRLLNENESSD